MPSPATAPSWTKGRGFGAWPAGALIGCPEVPLENKSLELSVLPTFSSPRTQTQSTSFAAPSSSFCAGYVAPNLSRTPGLTARDGQKGVPRKGVRGWGTFSSNLRVLKNGTMVGPSSSGCQKGEMRQAVFTECLHEPNDKGGTSALELALHTVCQDSTLHLHPHLPYTFSSPDSYHLWNRVGLASGWESVGRRRTLSISPKVPNVAAWGRDQVVLPKATWKGSAWWDPPTNQRLHQVSLLGPEEAWCIRMGPS